MESGLVFLARHGETDWNAAGRWQGQTDVPLNDGGREQARALGARMRGEGIVSVGSSDLSRARATAEIVAAALGLVVSYTDRALRERAYGVFEGLTLAECQARFPDDWARFGEPGAAPAGGESLEALGARMQSGVLRAATQMAPPALLVSHGRAIRELVSRIIGTPVGPIANGGVYRVVIERGSLVRASALP